MWRCRCASRRGGGRRRRWRRHRTASTRRKASTTASSTHGSASVARRKRGVCAVCVRCVCAVCVCGACVRACVRQRARRLSIKTLLGQHTPNPPCRRHADAAGRGCRGTRCGARSWSAHWNAHWNARRRTAHAWRHAMGPARTPGRSLDKLHAAGHSQARDHLGGQDAPTAGDPDVPGEARLPHCASGTPGVDGLRRTRRTRSAGAWWTGTVVAARLV